MPSALACFEREVTDRAEPKVVASREAAKFYHSAAGCDPSGYGIEGVAPEVLPKLMAAMREKGVGASCTGSLVERVMVLHREVVG